MSVDKKIGRLQVKSLKRSANYPLDFEQLKKIVKIWLSINKKMVEFIFFRFNNYNNL